MGLYLCVFEGDEEIEGVEVGAYRDFATFRDAVATHLKGGSRYPNLMLHSDSEGTWSPEEARELEKELSEIAKAFEDLPPAPTSEWQSQVMRELGVTPRNLYECFIDVDGEPLIQRLIELCRISQKSGRPVLFQ